MVGLDKTLIQYKSMILILALLFSLVQPLCFTSFSLAESVASIKLQRRPEDVYSMQPVLVFAQCSGKSVSLNVTIDIDVSESHFWDFPILHVTLRR
jgi:hypothetical protein